MPEKETCLFLLFWVNNTNDPDALQRFVWVLRSFIYNRLFLFLKPFAVLMFSEQSLILTDVYIWLNGLQANCEEEIRCHARKGERTMTIRRVFSS